MSVQPQPLKIGFAGGLNTKADSKTVPTTQLLDLVNCTFTKQTTLSKRYGRRALGQMIDGLGAPYANANGMGQRGDEIVLFANANSYSYRPSSDSWAPIQAVSSVVATDVPVARTGTHQTVPDIAVNRGVQVVAWEDSRGGVWCSVLEQASQRIVLAPVQLDADGQRPRCVAVGTVLHVYWTNSVRIWCAIVNPAIPEAAPTKTIITEDLAAGYDACSTYDAAFVDSQPALIAWGVSGGYRIGYVHPSGVLGSPVTGLPVVGTWLTGNIGPIACSYWLAGPTIAATGAYAVVLYGFATTSAAVRFFDPSNFNTALGSTHVQESLTAPIRVAIEFGEPHTDGVTPIAWWAVEIQQNPVDVNLVTSGSVDANSIVTPNTVVHGHSLTSRAFLDGADVYCALVHPVLYFPYVAICQISANMRAQSRMLPGQSAGILTRGHVPSAVPIAARQHAIALGNRIQLTGTSGKQFGEVGIRVATFDFDHAQSYQTTQLGRGLYLAGSMPQSYDGLRWAESDFHCAPDTASGTITTTQTTGGSLTTTSTYLYRFAYEEIDAQGELHPGACGVPVTVALTGPNDKVTLTIPTYRLTSKLRVRIGVFRTVANQTGTIDQIEFFRVSSVDPNDPQYLLNDTTTDSVTFVDTMSDATLAVLEPLYINGGILSNDPFPMSGAAIAGGKSRLFWTDTSNPNLVRYSQQLRDDTAVEASIALGVLVDPYGGPIVAIGVMDDAVYAFKTASIYAFGGPGPDADGGKTSNNAFTPAQLITADVGCVDPNSVCQSPLGLVFKSAKGFKLLGRDQQVTDIGAPVYGFNDQTVTRATLLPNRHEILFLTSSGSALLYNYEFQQWSRFTNHEGYDALVSGGLYYYLRTDGRVFVETPSAYRDDNMHVPMLIETAWIKAAGYLQGWQRILWAMFLGNYISAHTLRVRYRIDYQDGYSAPFDLPVNSNYNPDLYGAGAYGAGAYGGAGGATTVYQRQIHLNKRCQAIAFRIEDVEATADYGASFELSELLLTGGVLGPKFRVGAARSS